jgi:hypothetical protein
MNIREILVPDAYKLFLTEEGEVESVIVDQELDPFNVVMGGDNCIQIYSGDMDYITLSIEDLQGLIKLIRKADKLSQKNYKS